MENAPENPNKRMWMIGVIIAMAIILSFSAYYLYTSNDDKIELLAQKEQLSYNFKNLSDTLDLRRTELEQIKSANVQLDSTLTQSELNIEAKKKQIAGLLSKAKMSKAELAEAKKMISEYEVSITDLQQKVAELGAQNQQLSRENQQLGSDLNAEKQTNANLNEKNVVLSKRIEVGSLLQLAKIEVIGVKRKPNGNDREVKSAKAVESLRISFETGANKVLNKGPLSLFIRVINPKGETISVANQGSGILQLTETNSQVQYSTRADIDWAQANKKVSVYWNQHIAAAGNYKIEMYQSGYLIGKGQVTLN